MENCIAVRVIVHTSFIKYAFFVPCDRSFVKSIVLIICDKAFLSFRNDDPALYVISIIFQEAVFYSILLVADHCIKINVFHAVEDICLNVRVFFLQFSNQLFRLQAFG